MNYINISNSIRKSAERFIKSKNIESILSKHGNVLYTGSYLTNLMTWNDIDMQLVLDRYDDINVFTEIAKDILSDDDAICVRIMNSCQRKKSPKMPTGICLNVDYSVSESSSKWKLDIWSLHPDDLNRDIRLSSKILNNINDDIRYMVLKLKFRFMDNGERVPQLVSYHIYQAIFEHNITSESLIVEYIKNQGISV